MRTLTVSLTMALGLLLARAGVAQDCGAGACRGSANCCAHCGGSGPCLKKTCQLVCGVEKVKKHTFEVKCEEFCPLLPGRGCKTCDACDGKGCPSCSKLGRGAQKCVTPPMVEPKCGATRTKKTLVRKEYECEVPSYKCVVVYLCSSCAKQGGDPAPATAAPPAAADPAYVAPAPAAPLPATPQPAAPAKPKK